MLRTLPFLALVVLPMLVCACSGDETPRADAPDVPAPLAPPDPGTGVQFRMTTTVEPGTDDERCQFFVVPAGGLTVNQLAIDPQGTHHVFLWKTPYTSVPTQDEHGKPVDGTKLFECSNGVTADWKVEGILAGAQAATDDKLLPLPEGIAVTIPEGTVLIMIGHFLNPQTTKFDADVRINMYTIPPETVSIQAGLYMHVDPFIRIDPMGTASARMSCPVPDEVTILNTQSHMHKHGLGQDAFLIHPDGTPEPFYHSSDWQHVPVEQWRPGKVVESGSAIDFQCNYRNNETHVVTQGTSSSDEMCVITGFYYPVNPTFANCSLDGDPTHSADAATFIGTGSKSCAESLSCVASAKPISADKGDSLYGCMVNSCPGVAKELTASFRCLAAKGGAACATACAGGTTAPECKSCIQGACKPAIDACIAAQCG